MQLGTIHIRGQKLETLFGGSHVKGTVPMPTPANPAPASVETVQYGVPVLPIERIRLFSPDQWEDFVLEWADSLRSRYSNVERCAGAGDMGRDVIAFHKNAPDHWDNYQCKH